MTGYIDIHAHAFPDALAERAMKQLEEEGDIQARLDGRVASLIGSMDACGIETSVVVSVATKPAHFDAILNWSGEIASSRIVPFPSFAPRDPQWADRVRRVADGGFKGVKLHPYYRDFVLDDQERMFPIYERLSDAGLIVLMHTGFDFAFPRARVCDPDRILMEISFSLQYLDQDRARRMILNHPPRYVLFGTDSPWDDQQVTLNRFRALQLGADRERLILRDNALALLNASAPGNS